MNIDSCQKKQHAFRKWHSCETQLITVIDNWAKILDKQGQVDTFILDFEKAFDTPPPHMNFSKVNCLAMELEENYKMDRCFPVFQATESCCKWS